MADIRNLYREVLSEYAPWDYFEDKEIIESNMNLNNMLYNLICITQLNFEDCTDEELKQDEIYNKMMELINLLTILGARPECTIFY